MLFDRLLRAATMPVALCTFLFGCRVDDTDESDDLDEPAYAEQAADAVLDEHNFLLEVSGVTPGQKTIIGGFKSLSGMDSESDVIELRQGLSMTGDWAGWVSAGAKEKRDGVITFLEPGAPVRELRFEDASVEAYVTKTGGIATLRLRVSDAELVARDQSF